LIKGINQKNFNADHQHWHNDGMRQIGDTWLVIRKKQKDETDQGG